MGKATWAQGALTEVYTRLAKLLAQAPRDKAQGIKVLGRGSDTAFDELMARGHAPLGDNLFFGGPRDIDPVLGRQTFLAEKPAHAMYYADLLPSGKGSLSVYRGDTKGLPVIDNYAPDTQNLIDILLGYGNASLHDTQTWAKLPSAERQMLEQINDVGGAKLLNIDDYTATARRYTSDEHEAPQYILLPEKLRKFEKRAKGGLVQMKGHIK